MVGSLARSQLPSMLIRAAEAEYDALVGKTGNKANGVRINEI